MEWMDEWMMICVYVKQNIILCKGVFTWTILFFVFKRYLNYREGDLSFGKGDYEQWFSQIYSWFDMKLAIGSFSAGGQKGKWMFYYSSGGCTCQTTMGIYVRDCWILKHLEAISKVSLLLWNNIGAVYPRVFVNLWYNYERYGFSLWVLHATWNILRSFKTYTILPKSVNFFKKEEIFYIQISKQNNGVVLIFSVDDTSCEFIHLRFHRYN